MEGAVGVLEIASVARGIMVTDTCLKTANIQLLFAQPVCPGKYLIIIGGEVAAVQAALEAVDLEPTSEIVDKTLLGNIHPDVFAAIAGQTPVNMEGALGVVELFTVPAGILAADLCAKAAVVQLIDLQMARGLGGKAVLYIRGEVGAVSMAIKAVEKQFGQEGLLGATAIIAAPHPELWPKIW
ncbi:BMC domain-containing protein [Neomoorella humiferrea]|uniref:BMC domain-containing protein n=1 Tax=Neomoorella humiferrea TaxID=676965 RepID=UPI003D8EA86D